LSRSIAGILLLGALCTFPGNGTGFRESGVTSSIRAQTRGVHTLITALVILPTVVGIGENSRLLAVERTSLRHPALGLPGASEGSLVAAEEIVVRLAAQHRYGFPVPGGIAKTIPQSGAVQTNEAGKTHILAGVIISLN